MHFGNTIDNLHQFASADPRGFLARYPDGAVLDEIQRAPELLSYLQVQPWHTNVGKRLVKSPKLYFLDPGLPDDIRFYRDSKGNEVDFVVGDGPTVGLIEVKSGTTVQPEFFKGFHQFEGWCAPAAFRRLVYGGEATRTQDGVEVVGWREAGIV